MPKKTKKAAVPPVVVKKPPKRGSIFAFGDLPICAVLRWLGKNSFSVAEAVAALKSAKVSKMPALPTIATQLHAGASGQRGDPAVLTVAQQKILRDAKEKRNG